VPFAFSISDIIPATPRAIYDAWLDSKGHAAMTGGHEARASSRKGAKHMAWGGYIEGRNIALDPGRRIVQSWRTAKFSHSDEDSQIEILLEPAAGGTKVTVNHSNVPDGHTSYRDGGWQKSYFEPMKGYFKAMR
jgi:uncharacterized protein YndB with AHSA1/START domain